MMPRRLLLITGVGPPLCATTRFRDSLMDTPDLLRPPGVAKTRILTLKRTADNEGSRSGGQASDDRLDVEQVGDDQADHLLGGRGQHSQAEVVRHFGGNRSRL